MQSLKRFDAGYKSLFRQRDDRQDNEDQSLEDDQDQQTHISFYEHWSWITSLDAISNSNPLMWDEICRRNVVWFLNVLSYYKDKAAFIEELNKEK